MIKLSRVSCFIAGIVILLLVYTGERMRFVAGSSKITAKFVFYIDENVNQEQVSFPIIEYVQKSKYTQTDTVYQFRAKENTTYQEGEEVPVLLINKDPDNPKLYTVGSFWLFPLVYYVLPVLLWVAFCFSFIGKKEKIAVNFWWPFFQRSG